MTGSNSKKFIILDAPFVRAEQAQMISPFFLQQADLDGDFLSSNIKTPPGITQESVRKIRYIPKKDSQRNYSQNQVYSENESAKEIPAY